MKKIYLSLGLFVVLIFIWLTRFSVYPAHKTDATTAYKLDRWTGNVTVYFGPIEIATRKAKKSPDLSFLPVKPGDSKKSEWGFVESDEK